MPLVLVSSGNQNPAIFAGIDAPWSAFRAFATGRLFARAVVRRYWDDCSSVINPGVSVGNTPDIVAAPFVAEMDTWSDSIVVEDDATSPMGRHSPALSRRRWSRKVHSPPPVRGIS